ELLPGERELPLAARLLPDAARLRLGVQFESKDVLGINGIGAGAIGSYHDGSKRYRIAAIDRPNEQSAQDVIKTLKRTEGASETKGPPPSLTLLVRGASDGTKSEWVFGRAGRAVIGIGDDEHSGSDRSNPAGRLSSSEKQAKLTSTLNDVMKRLPPPTGP
ncbi:MAG TPA: hypothetical protein VIV60_22660, partial [Polyangiaceae bacterium]